PSSAGLAAGLVSELAVSLAAPGSVVFSGSCFFGASEAFTTVADLATFSGILMVTISSSAGLATVLTSDLAGSLAVGVSAVFCGSSFFWATSTDLDGGVSFLPACAEGHDFGDSADSLTSFFSGFASLAGVFATCASGGVGQP